jgi:peptide/nickel transport system ATP-binding protein
MDESPVIEVAGLSVHYAMARGSFRRRHEIVRAVEDVSFSIAPGETLGLVGESGSGKTTTGRAILRQVDATSGTIRFEGRDITHLGGETLRRLRQHLQMVFQDPYGTLNPRMRVFDILAEPMVVHGRVRRPREAAGRVAELLELTGLPADAASRYPHSFSGGQRQRIGIARALAIEPRFLVVDEPVAALDTSIQAQIINLLQDLQERLDLTFLFIAHDLAVVRHISDRIAVMYAGRLVEIATSDQIYLDPLHPYTVALLAAVPIPDPEAKRQRALLPVEAHDPTHVATGCPFAPRCPDRRPGRCDDEVPQLREVEPGHWAACHWASEPTSGPAPSSSPVVVGSVPVAVPSRKTPDLAQ